MAVSTLEGKRSLPFLRLLALLIFAGCLPVLPWLVMGPLAGTFEPLWVRAVVMVVLSAAEAALLKLAFGRLGWIEALAAGFITQGLAYRLALFLPELSTSPLSLGWSEASRYYYASLYLAKSIYGFETPPSVLHPTRYLMQAVPFLIPSLPLWFHRLWQVLLWLVFTGWAASLLAKRLALPKGLWTALAGLWGFIFLFQGPVYYHLAVMLIAVLWGYHPKRPVQTFIVVIAASLWAGVSRINWLPVPGMLAAALYFLEEDSGKRGWLRYLLKPILWTAAGTAAGTLSMKLYELFSGNPAYVFGSSFSSDLLWYRLRPSATYGMGVLGAVVLVSLPLAIILFWWAIQSRGRVHVLRILGLAAMLAVLGVGGLVVSTKIGGGSNLHNMDAYLALLLICGAMVAFGRVREEGQAALRNRIAPGWMLLLAAAVPSLFLLTTGGTRWIRPDLASAEAAVQMVRETVEPTVVQGGRVLFISERHLVTFGKVEAPLEPDYERVFLMEMAMAGNRPYLDQFHTDLREHRFVQIIVQTQRVLYQGPWHAFGEENDAWVENVSEPLLCWYEPGVEIPEAGLTIYIPRVGEQECP